MSWFVVVVACGRKWVCSCRFGRLFSSLDRGSREWVSLPAS